MTNFRQIVSSPLFTVGLMVRLALLLAVAPLNVRQWYAPFMAMTTGSATLDPWGAWLAAGGALEAFPYGWATWLALAPLTLLCEATGFGAAAGYFATLLIADLAMLLLLQHWVEASPRLVLATYWCSPIVLLATYGLGLNDLLPALALTAAITLLRRHQVGWSGAASAAAISAKLSMIVATPFFLLYLHHTKSLRGLLPTFLLGTTAAGLVLGVPFVLSPGAMRMLVENTELAKVFALSVHLGANATIHIVPLAYLSMLYAAWRLRRFNFELFLATMGLAFLLLVLLTPASPGWFVWCLPFLVHFQARAGRLAFALTSVFSCLYVLSSLLITPLHLAWGGEILPAAVLRVPGVIGEHTASLIHTVMVAAGTILAVRMGRESISRNEFFRLSRRPFVIGIAGDSGSGKDTLADALEGLFGRHSVVRLSGDDYHLWDRRKPMWQVMSHLNPMANDLERYSRDLVALVDGKAIQVRRYDHKTGVSSRPSRLNSNDFILATGLHALYQPLLRDCMDLKIYLAMDENLRRALKICRDTTERGRSPQEVHQSLEKREVDAVQFVRPQAGHADLILSLETAQPERLATASDPSALPMKLVVQTRRGFSERSLVRTLVGICGLHVDSQALPDGLMNQLTIEGDVSGADLAWAARTLCPYALEFLDLEPHWAPGALGLMQLVTLSHINQSMTRTLI
jgi:uridine kinase